MKRRRDNGCITGAKETVGVSEVSRSPLACRRWLQRRFGMAFVSVELLESGCSFWPREAEVLPMRQAFPGS